MHHYCTYFDRHYLARGLTLYGSLQHHAGAFSFWVLCLDDFTYDVLSQLDLPNVHPVPLHEFESNDEALVAAKQDRTRKEYYFTCTPSWPLYILDHFPDVDLITYLDSDLFFYSGPSRIFEEMGNDSVLIVPHRFSQHLRERERYGIYNVGLVAFRGDRYGKECLQSWREQCLEWCYFRAEKGRFADQKYLDDWPVRFPRVVVLQHKGAGLAPWNIADQSLTLREEQVLVDSEPLVFFHFQGLRRLARWLYDPNLAAYRVCGDALLKRHVYAPYVRALDETARWLPGALDWRLLGTGAHGGAVGPVRATQGILRRAAHRGADQLATTIWFLRRYLCDVLRGNLWVVIGGRIL